MHRTVVGALVAALTLSLTVVAPVAPAAADTDRPKAEVEQALVAEIHRERAARGLPRLTHTLQQQRKAREHSQLMRDTDHLHHPPRLADEIFPADAWLGIAENAARSRSVTRAHAALMASEPHRNNILGDWTHVAVGVAYDGSRLWVTQRFVRVRAGHHLPMFTDMPATPWQQRTVERAWQAELLHGCGRERVCARAPLSRAQTATLVARAAGVPDRRALGIRFVDVGSAHTHAGAIGALVEHGVTRGCRHDRFCPDDEVTRAETASLIQRARTWSELDQQRFSDVVRGTTHFGSVNRLAEQGVTAGCGDGRYCPGRPISRVEAARLLLRGF